MPDAASWLQRPPISMPNTTSRQRRARSSSGYRLPVFSGALRGRARCQDEHSCIDGELGAMPHRQAVAHYLYAPCITDGTSIFMSTTRTLRATRAPASRHTRANARSKGSAPSGARPMWRRQRGGLRGGPVSCIAVCQSLTRAEANILQGQIGDTYGSGRQRGIRKTQQSGKARGQQRHRVPRRSGGSRPAAEHAKKSWLAGTHKNRG